MSSELPRRRESAPPGRPWLDTLAKENPLEDRGEQYIQARDEGGIGDAGVLKPDGLECDVYPPGSGDSFQFICTTTCDDAKDRVVTLQARC